ncbi:MAG: hypothetical protein JRN45_00300 [Nitrososphaerota archaeon]|nr:hypothetical protein [Nitrososphaerota archaeon]
MRDRAYCATGLYPSRPDRLKDAVIAELLISGPEEVRSIHQGIAKSLRKGVRLSRPELERLLESMEKAGFVQEASPSWLKK